MKIADLKTGVAYATRRGNLVVLLSLDPTWRRTFRDTYALQGGSSRESTGLLALDGGYGIHPKGIKKAEKAAVGLLPKDDEEVSTKGAHFFTIVQPGQIVSTAEDYLTAKDEETKARQASEVRRQELGASNTARFNAAKAAAPELLGYLWLTDRQSTNPRVDISLDVFEKLVAAYTVTTLTEGAEAQA